MKITEFISKVKKIDCIAEAKQTDSYIFIKFKDKYATNNSLIAINKSGENFYTNYFNFMTVPKKEREQLMKLCTEYLLSSEIVKKETHQKFYVVTKKENEELQLFKNKKTKRIFVGEWGKFHNKENYQEYFTEQELDKYFKKSNINQFCISIEVPEEQL